MSAPAVNPHGIWQRFRALQKPQNTAEIARRTGIPEHEVERIVWQGMEARFSKKRMPWMETP